MLRNFDKPHAGSLPAQEYGYTQGVTLTAGAGIGGGYSFRTTTAKTGDLNNGVYEGVASQHRTGTKGVWSNFTVAGASDSAVIDVWQGDSFLQVRPVGNDLQVWTVNSGVIFTAAGVLSPGTFKRVELQWTVSSLDELNSLNFDGSVELRVDLVSAGSASNIQLGFALPSGYTTRDVFWNVVVFNPHGDGDKHYLTDGSGDLNTGYLPDNVNVYIVSPNEDGSYTELTPSTGTDHYAMVDETTPDDDTSYLACEGAAKRDTFNYEDFASIGSQRVYGLKQVAYGKKVEAGYRRFRPLAIRAGLPQYATVDYPIGVGYFAWCQHIWETDPFLGGYFKVSNINSTEFGMLVG